jgi:hypothetical protein
MKVKELYQKVVDGVIISDIELQRAIVYDAEKQELVIDSIYNGIPLPAFYLWENKDGILEVLDGKQRIEAIKKFKQGNLTYKGKTWKGYAYDSNVQTIIDEAELTTIICKGNEELKREIFKRINTLGVPLSNFEVLNGLFHGVYLEGLNDYFQQDSSIRKVLPNESMDRGNNKYRLLNYIYYLRHESNFPKRHELDDYISEMKDNSFNEEVKKIKPYISFIKDVFGDSSKIPSILKFKLSVKYIKDRSIWLQNKDSIIRDCNNFIKSAGYKLSQSKELDIEDVIIGIIKNLRVDPKRLFTEDDKNKLLLESERDENGLYICKECGQHFRADELTIDHIIPWSKGGRTVLSNAQLLCRACNSSKGNKSTNFHV